MTREDVLRCARLAHLALDEAEIEPMRQAMAQMLDHAASLDSLALDAVEPTAYGLLAPLPRRPDLPAPGLTQAQALANAPDAEDGCFRVPRVL